jgi:hypothetical protein
MVRISLLRHSQVSNPITPLVWQSEGMCDQEFRSSYMQYLQIWLRELTLLLLLLMIRRLIVLLVWMIW